VPCPRRLIESLFGLLGFDAGLRAHMTDADLAPIRAAVAELLLTLRR